MWQEYPRPGLVRDSYLNLNGEWEYRISQAENTGRYDGQILVPFSPESVLSGVERRMEPKHFLYYKKCFQIPDGFNKGRIILHFEAVDQECTVYLNGIGIGVHKGGYLPFHFDITGVLEKENVLTLQVTDHTEKRPHARGKQKLVKKGMLSSLFYTPQSGIWQTVWLESVPEDFIDWVKITPMYDDSAVRMRIKALHAETVNTGGCLTGSAARRVTEKPLAHVVILDGEKVAAEADAVSGKDVVIKLENFYPWSPEDPHLYDVKITMGQDEVRSYFGMRKVSVGRDKNGILRFFLNNQPYFFNGILDQGYWPESLMTPPSDEALEYDIKKLREMGYNTIRKHVKIEQERFYYHCDRLGMIVWQDMPNGGGEYNMLFVTYLPNLSDRFARAAKDSHYKAACKKAFGYRHYSSSEELTANYRRLWEEEIFPNLERGLSAAIYTQVSDIEEEMNGIMTYDREVLKLDLETVIGLNQRLYEYFRHVTGC